MVELRLALGQYVKQITAGFRLYMIFLFCFTDDA